MYHHLQFLLFICFSLFNGSSPESSTEIKEISSNIKKLTDTFVGSCSSSKHDYLSLERRLTDLENRLNGHSPLGQTVFFNAYSSNALICDSGCNVTYTQTFGDSHSALDVQTGIFECPRSGHYFFQFHALVESGHEARVIILVNDVPTLYMYDKDHAKYNWRYSMISQSLIYAIHRGDKVVVRLHKGALKGGGSHAFTSFVGMLVQENDDGINKSKSPKSLFK
ncbi:collagen alpha-2(VIII) chain [Lepeophtheirus salmonis]|uniref:Collagen, type VIII, alpha 2 [Falco peregrinus] n=1 Tax=Lepeophtheirus salmonis TaxID=72036 RepID=A0A0K2TPV1_LEPSM|nr:collagen alpha-2(VIII) chain-like [Lepeophtheirus salmonis]